MVATVAMAAAMVATVGCDEKKPETAIKKDDKKDDKKDATSAKLEAAMAAAASAKARGPAQQAEGGPPATGVFGPGAADKVMVRGAPMKVEMVSDGSAPRVAIVAAPTSWKGNATVTTGVRLGQRNALPSIEYVVGLGPDKKKDDKGAGGAAPAAAGLSLIGDVTSAKLGADQPGRLPEGTAKEIGKLKGSQLRWLSDDQGVAREPSSVVSKDGQAELQRSLDAAAEAFFYLSVPPPPKPVGAGASWIAGSRQVLDGVEVVSYRLYKVVSVSPEGVQLTLESHEYAVSDTLTFPGLPPGSTLGQFEAVAQGEMTLPAREALATKGRISRQMTLAFPPPAGAPQQQPGGMMALQIVNEATVTRGGK